jgi:transcriptional regulator NrdR family protein
MSGNVSPKSQEDYLIDSGQCPWCNSTEVSWNTKEDSDGNEIWKDNECTACNKKWFETYTLESYEEMP